MNRISTGLIAAQLAALTLTACDAGRPHFEVRGMASKAEKQSYGTSFHATATVIGSGPASTKPYLVWYTTKLTGGDPDSPRDGVATVLVKDGIGDLDIYLGIRDSNATWPAPAVELVPLGYVAITSFK